MNQANGTMPTTNTRPSHGVAAARPRSSISRLANGVMRMPPTDSPVEATDSATDRRSWNQRVTTVVAGTSPGRRESDAEDAVDDEQLPLLVDLSEQGQRHAPDESACDDHVSNVVAGDQPGDAAHRPTPPTMKKMVVANEIVFSGQPCSLLNALR